MLIEISSSVIDQLNAEGQNEKVSIALDQLAYGRRNGRHELSGTLKDFRELANSSRLSPAARGVYKKMYGRLVQIGGLASKFNTRVRITSGAGASTFQEFNGKVIIEIPVETFSGKSLADRTVLLCENLSDIRLYGTLARFHLAENGLTQFYVSYEPQGGGGSTVSDAYNEIQNSEERFCLCITDSDLRGPGAAIGDTARRVGRIDDPAKPSSTFTYLRVRAIENLLSVAILKEIAKIDPETSKKIAVFVNISNSKHGEALRFANVKDGIILSKILKTAPDSAIRKFWMEIAGDYAILGCSITPECLHLAECKKEGECSCVIIPALGKGIVHKAMENVFDSFGMEMIKPLLDNITGPEWQRVGRMVAEWCFSSGPLVAT
jgi:hypothetical protein